ncbi:MAG: helix-turn-helix transcriptional regulator, partial [Eggerthellaceae bacterium]|nr:helix-turn-helix transcriptional regulator [Eggerthellaceae bacterium]
SKREKDVLRQLAMGHDATRISEELSISWNTVRTHTRNVYAKLGVHSRQEVVDLVDSYKDRY